MTNSFKKKLPIKNALLVIDIQEKIIAPINNKDSIIENIQKLLKAYQILDENIFISEQNPLKLGKTLPNLLTASTDKLFEVEGIGRSRAQQLREYFDTLLKNVGFSYINGH